MAVYKETEIKKKKNATTKIINDRDHYKFIIWSFYV